MKVVITGAAGHLGRACVQAFHAGGHDVLALDQVRWADSPVPFRVVDLRQPEMVSDLITGGDVLIHLANRPNPNVGSPQQIFADNAAMNINAFEAAVGAAIRRLVFASSIQAINGLRRPRETKDPVALPYLPLDGDVPARPANAYAASKVAGEELLRMYARHYGVAAVAVRLPGLMRPEWAPHLGTHRLQGDAHEAFAFLMYSDAARLFVACAEAPLEGFRTYLPALRENVTLRPPAELIARFYPHVPLRRPIDQIEALVDNSRITAETGWAPRPLADFLPDLPAARAP